MQHFFEVVVTSCRRKIVKDYENYLITNTRLKPLKLWTGLTLTFFLNKLVVAILVGAPPFTIVFSFNAYGLDKIIPITCNLISYEAFNDFYTLSKRYAVYANRRNVSETLNTKVNADWEICYQECCTIIAY